MPLEFDSTGIDTIVAFFGAEFANEIAAEALGAAGGAILDDCINEEPMVPLDKGTLRGSGSVFVQGKLVQGDPSGFDGSQDTGAGGIFGSVGFNTPYAAYQHEGVREDGTHVIQNYSHEGTGPKFLEAKIQANGDRYSKVARDHFAQAIADRIAGLR